MVTEPLEPRQLVVVVVVPDLAPVWHVHAVDADPAACCGHQPGVGVGLDTVGEAEERSLDPHLRQDRNAVPLTLPVVDRFVAELGEGESGKRLVGELGLLEADDVGFGLGEPLLDSGQDGP